MLGKQIAHYSVESELGRGGMGVVYRARDLRLERTVALKLLAEEYAQRTEQRQLILSEARAAAALNHPGVTTIYEVGEHEGRLFIAMELVAGKSLRELLREGAFEPRRLIRFATQIAEALEAVHLHGVRHGDIKPENIVVQADDRIKLLDFGIASRVSQAALTATSAGNTTDDWTDRRVAGTLAYMAPEVLRGEHADGRADLFALGVILYELATAKRPFAGASATQLIAQILDSNTTPAQITDPKTPAALETMIFKLLRKVPAERYPSARDLRLDLLNLLRDLDIGESAHARVAGKRAVAVLPFKLLTPSAEDDYLGVALADAVIHALGSGGDVLVRPTSAVERYAKQSIDPQRAARELNVQIVAQGSIQKAGTRLRVHIQAWNVNQDSAIYSAKHDAEIHELFSLQDELSVRLGAALGLNHPSTGHRAPAAPTDNPHAYELFLRAADRLARLNRWDTRTAIEMLERAVLLDPKFPDAWARLAEACVLIGSTQEPHPRWLKRASEAIRKALALDRHNAEAHCARGRLLWTPAQKFQNRPALRALREALHINPGCHAARIWQCLILLHLGLHEEARAGLMEALAAQPDDAFTLVFIGQTAMYRCDYAEAREYNARALSVDRLHIWANGFSPNVALYEGKLNEAEEKIKLARQVLANDPWLVSCEALLWAQRGDRKKAEALARKSLQPVKAFLHTHHLWHTAAAAYALIEQPSRAIALLRRAGAQGLPNYPAFRDDPLLSSLHTQPAFRNLLGKLKREWESYRREFGNL
jgi:TolB-like protein/predicted Zn-dependent protease/predicted Ser/Thr protein kinase